MCISRDLSDCYRFLSPPTFGLSVTCSLLLMSLYVPECFILDVKVLDTGMQGLFISLESVNVLENTVIQNYQLRQH